MKKITRVIPKKNTQAMIKALRKAGYTVEKTNGGIYTCKVNSHEIFKALNGSRGYLVTMAENLFTQA